MISHTLFEKAGQTPALLFTPQPCVSKNKEKLCGDVLYDPTTMTKVGVPQPFHLPFLSRGRRLLIPKLRQDLKTPRVFTERFVDFPHGGHGHIG